MTKILHYPHLLFPFPFRSTLLLLYSMGVNPMWDRGRSLFSGGMVHTNHPSIVCAQPFWAQNVVHRRPPNNLRLVARFCVGLEIQVEIQCLRVVSGVLRLNRTLISNIQTYWKC